MPATTIRSDLFFGTLYGLAASAAVWAFVLAPPAAPWTALALVPLAIACGTLMTRSRRWGPIPATYPIAVAGAWIGGPAVALAGSAFAAISSRMLGRSQLGSRPRRGWAAELSVIVLVSACAALAMQLTRHALELRGPIVAGAAGLAAFATAWGLVLRGLTRVAIRMERGGAAPRHARKFVRPLLVQIAGTLAGSTLALVWPSPGGPYLLASLALLVLAGVAFESRLRARRAHRRAALEQAALCASVVGGLTRLIEARDSGTAEHLRRVQRLCIEVASGFGLSSDELDALSAAALLHDVGKLAVPEGILSKPGRLTSEETMRMRIHPEVGARVLEAIPFPYPLAAIVRHHHERWDGQGYPSGLRGEEIPIGARILAAVDTFDALTTDRPYRRAISHEQALGFLEQEAGQTFDPQVVDCLIEHLEQPGAIAPVEDPRPQLVLDNARPAAERMSSSGSLPRSLKELELLYEVLRARKSELGLDDYLTLVCSKLRRHVPHATCVVYVLDARESMLHARFSIGQAAEELSALSIPLGERLSGWAALQRRAFVGHDHRSPIERDGCRSDLEDGSGRRVAPGLGSTLVAPMVHEEKTLGTLTLYDVPERRFTPEERRLLVRIAGYVAQVIDQPSAVSQLADRSLTDPLTGVPNARFLRLETAHRIARHEESGEAFGLLAFRVGGLEQVGERWGIDEADRLLSQVARRFAASCTNQETLVRFGQEMFVVLCSTSCSGELVERWHQLRSDVEQPPLTACDGDAWPLRLSAAHAAFPSDGEQLDELLETLDARLSLAEQRRIVPFRAPHAVPSRVLRAGT